MHGDHLSTKSWRANYELEPRRVALRRIYFTGCKNEIRITQVVAVLVVSHG